MHVDTLEAQLRILMETPDDVRYLDVDAIVDLFNQKKHRRPLHFPEPEQNAVEAFDSRKRTGGHCLASLPASNQIRQPEYCCLCGCLSLRHSCTVTLFLILIDRPKEKCQEVPEFQNEECTAHKLPTSRRSISCRHAQHWCT